ncbi:ABC transporter ATP-binding protein [Crassaminicella profunda]|uniref:ABC transporter ATP-binding protein n=1 Tax=Crassaminicella profunda TaxID=1286698 RepID=UPI001CA6FE81|nr:ABC transporter ATP-binding protein [Crassaminicella profunda]QZY55948.1 ABC transporter ATP-binding protein/permease [Crassaminicella profunda]
MNQKSLVKEVKSKNRISNIMIAFKVVLDLFPQVLMIHMVSKVFEGALTRNMIWVDCGLMLVSFFLKAVCAYVSTWKAHDAAYNCLMDLRLQLISHLKKLSLGFFQERKIGDLTNIIQHDVEQVEIYLAHGLPEIMSATLLPVIIFLVMLLLDWRLALVMISTLPLMQLTKKLSTPIWEKMFEIFANSTKNMQDHLMEYITNISVIKAFGKEETKTDKTIKSSKDYVYWMKKSMGGISIPMGLIDIFMEGGVVLVIILGTYFLSMGEISVPKFILALILGMAFTSSIAKTATFQHYNVVFNQSMKGIGSVLNVPTPQRIEQKNSITDGTIQIHDLDFSYPGKGKSLKNINLTFRKGSKNALVGASGCGKSTLANLLMGFWEPENGTISINGVDTKDMSEKQLNALTAMVQQEVFLFNMSIEENIRIGKPDATMDEIVEAAKKARIHDFIMSLPDQYDSTAGEAGVKFSGGEKQRISIARMILKDAPIIILDEATAAVDAENESYIQSAIEDLSKDKTVIMIAHHLNTIKDVDQIVVMDHGKIIHKGNHDELMRSCELYEKMVYNQNKVDHWNIKEGSN